MKNRQTVIIIFGLTLLLLACGLGGQATAIPAGPPADFDVQTATATIDPAQATAEAEPLESEAVVIVPLGDAPTHTPDPNATVPIEPTDTPVLVATSTPTPTVASPTLRATAIPTKPAVTPDPPLQGGDWDFEGDFIPWPNPHGEPCPGASVAAGWLAFVEKGDFGSSCMNENTFGPNVFTGFKSQEITFDFIAANSGIYRTIPTKVDRRYSIVAYAKHDRSTVPVQMFLGVDLTGGTTWNGETVQWTPWAGSTEDTWTATEVTVTATGESMTIFIRGFHPVAEQGGKTVIDNVSVTDLGL